MKNAKTSRIVALLLALVLVISSAFGLSAMADGEAETPAVEIAAYNISMGGSISVMYAVKSTGLASGQYVVIEGTALNPVDGTSEPFTVKDSTLSTYDIKVGEENFGKLPVYYTPGIPLKNMATEITAKAVVYNSDGSKANVESEEITYSVLEYLYARQFDHADNTPDQKALYDYLLGAGDKVQAVLGYGAGHAPSDYAYATIEGGTVEGRTHGIIPKGATVTLSGNEAGFVVTPLSLDENLDIVEGASVTVANNGTYTVTGHVKAEPAEPYVSGVGQYFNNDTIYGTKQDWSSASAPACNKGNSSDVATTTVADGVLTIAAESVVGETYSTVLAQSNIVRDSYAVFEFEFKLSAMPEGTAWRFFEFNVKGLGGEFYLQVQDGRFVPVTKSGTEGNYVYTVIDGLPSFSANAWYTLSIKVDTNEAKPSNIPAELSVNNQSCGQFTIVNTQSRSWTNVRANVYIPAVNGASVSLDNTVIGFLPRGDYERGRGEDVANVNFDCSTTGKTENSGGGIATPVINSDGTATITSAANGQYARWTAKTTYAEGATQILEMDIKFDKWTATNSDAAAFRIDNGTTRYTIRVSKVDDNYISLGNANNILAMDTWYNLRFEFDGANKKVYLTVNGVNYGEVYSITGAYTKGWALLYIQNGDSVTIDNVYFNNVIE